MQEKLLKTLEAHFKQLTKPVKEEELLFFLDSRSRTKFDRETFYELTERVNEEGAKLSPHEFSKIYLSAYDVLESKQNQAVRELRDIDANSRDVLRAQKGILKVMFKNIEFGHIENTTDYVEFVVAGKFRTTMYYFGEEDTINVFVPDELFKSEAVITLRTAREVRIDEKVINIAKFSQKKERVMFINNTDVNFVTEVATATRNDVSKHITTKKAALQTYISFAKQKKDILLEPFRDLFLNEKPAKPTIEPKCSGLLKLTSALTILVFLLSLALNYTRCMFIDIFICVFYFGNMYIWRRFNLFLGIKLILVLIVSILIDLFWEAIKLYHYNSKYESTSKGLRILGLVFSLLNIGLKIILIYLYYRLSKESKNEDYLAIDDEVSINEVDEKDYLVNVPHYDSDHIGVARL